MKTLSDALKQREADNQPTAGLPRREQRMVIRHEEADGSIRYTVTQALLRRAAKAASRKNFEAA